MRGTPYFQAILMVAVFLLAGVPVYRLTRPATAATVASTAAVDSSTERTATVETAPLEVELVFAPAPVDFQIKALDQTVLAGRGPQTRFSARWTAAVPPEGVDLVVQAHWPASPTDSGVPMPIPAAVRVTVQFSDGRRAEKSFWAGADGALNDVFTVPGEPAVPAP